MPRLTATSATRPRRRSPPSSRSPTSFETPTRFGSKPVRPIAPQIRIHPPHQDRNGPSSKNRPPQKPAIGPPAPSRHPPSNRHIGRRGTQRSLPHSNTNRGCEGGLRPTEQRGRGGTQRRPTSPLQAPPPPKPPGGPPDSN